MYHLILRRIGRSLLAIIGVSIVAFIAVRVSGDMERFLLPPDAGPDDFARVRQEYGLDQPVYLQYLFFIAKAVTGDFGMSWRWHDPAWTVVIDRLPATMQLAAAAALIAFLIAVTVGPLSAARPGSWIDRIGRVFAILGQSMPAFWVGLMLIRVFAVDLRWLPSYGRGGLSNLVMPAISLGWYAAAAQTRLMRSAMLNVLDSEYVKLARLKGVPEFYVIYKHALRNAALPVLTLMGVQWAALLSGSVVIETIFAWPGVGRTLVEAIFNRDYAVVQAGTFLMSLIFVGANLTVDLLYGVLDPRIRRNR